MHEYTINAAGRIARLGDAKPEKGEEVFSSIATLGEAVTEIVKGDEKGSEQKFLIRVFNGIPGVRQVKQFENRKIALARIVKATCGIQVPASEQTTAAKAAKSRVRKALPQQFPAAKADRKPAAKGKTHAAAVGGEPREGSKRAIIIAALEIGATRERLMELTGWQAHSVRGFLSTLGKTRSITVTKDEDKVRTYALGA